MRPKISARCFRHSVFGCSRTTGVKTSDCGKLLASASTASIGRVNKNLSWFSCIGSRSNWVTGTSTTGWCPRALLGQPNTPKVGALKAVKNGPCSHDPRAFTQSPLEEVLVLMTRSKPTWGAESGRTVKTWAGRPDWERRIRLRGSTKLSRGRPGLRR